jgi:antitoxin component of MazEF toxin-antitoxin module
MGEQRPYDTTKVQDIGGSTGIIVPKRVAKFLNIRKGDKVFIDAQLGHDDIKYIIIQKREAKKDG